MFYDRKLANDSFLSVVAFNSFIGNLGYGMGAGGGAGPMDMISDMPHNSETRLEAMASTAASQEQVFRLFDLIPGLDYCDFDRHSGMEQKVISFNRHFYYLNVKKIL